MNAPQDPQDHLENKDLKDLLVRQERLENQVRLDSQGLRDLVARLEIVLAESQQHWYHKTTLLRWMIVILVLIVLDRLLSHFPTIAQMVKLLL